MTVGDASIARDARPEHGALTFFVAAFAFTWLPQLPSLLALWGVLPGPPERFLPLAGLGAFGPMLAAIYAARRESGREGVKALFRPLRAWRVGPVWYVLAPLLSGAIFVASAAVYRLLGGRFDGPWVYLPTEAPRLVALVVFPIGEELGWRGFAQPRLQRRYGPLAASAVIGLAWALWHGPMFALAGVGGPLVLATLVPFFVAGSVVFAWAYNRAGGSVWMAVLLHVGAHLNNTNRSLPGDATPLLLHTAGYCAVALALVLIDREAWRKSAAVAG